MEHIALAFSGGGFRAAAFSMGTLSYLNEKKYGESSLLHNVKFIGSSSGGTITNILYSSGICAGESFTDVYKKLLEILEGENLIKRVFEILSTNATWRERPNKSRNLINAFSIAYDELFYQKRDFGVFDELKNKHLEEVCINSTEFTNGISFRFQTQHHHLDFLPGLVGNYYINFKKESIDVANKIMLADILACSSCFSGGFEPFIFPDDFTHKALLMDELSQAINFQENPFTIHDDKNDELYDKDFKKIKNRFGLMDGGVADNQAIESVILANNRRKTKKSPEFDLIVVTDVTSYFMDGYTLPLEKKSWWGKFSIQQIIYVIMILGLVFPVLIVLSIFFSWQNWMYLLLIPTLLAFVIYLYGKIKLYRASKDAKKNKSTWSIILFKYVGFFLKLRITALNQMFKSRLKSVFLLANDIYLKQIRRHYYNLLYSDPWFSKHVVSNFIYDLSMVKQKAKGDENIKKILGFDDLDETVEENIEKPGLILIGVAEKARRMPTTLWFDEYQSKNQVKAAIVATGQFTTCYNLLKHLFKLQQVQTLSPGQERFKSDLLDDWKKFNHDPYYLYNALGASIKGFIPVKV